MINRLRALPPTVWAILLLTVATIFRFWFSTRMQLVSDEAYYWLWSKHLAASYRDKGPAIGWTIALGTRLFGDTVFGIRFFAVVCSAATGWILYVLARRLYDERTALWSLVLAMLIPMIAVGAILMTIDALSVLSWALAALLFWEAIHRDRLVDWVGLGLVIGLGFLAKFTNGVQLVCIGLFLLWSPAHRRWLFSRKFVALNAAFALSILPLVWWNIQTGWVHFTALHSRSGVGNSFGVHPSQLLRFVGEVFGVVSPLVMAGIVVAALGLWRTRGADLRTRFLLSQSLPLFAIFLFFSLNKAGKSNWIAPALFTSIIFTVVYWRDVIANRPGWRWGAAMALSVAGIMTVVLHDTDYLHLPGRLDPLRRAKGWDDFARHIQEARVKYRANLLIGDHYRQASLMSFYLPDHPTTFLLPEAFGASQFSMWPGYRKDGNTRALYIRNAETNAPWEFTAQFPNARLVDRFWTLHKGRPMNEFELYFASCDEPDTVPPFRSRSDMAPYQGRARLALGSEPPVGAPQQDPADGLKKEVGDPNQELWRELGPRLPGLGKNNETVVDQDQNERDAKSNRRFPAMRPDSQRDADQGEAHAGEGKRHLSMQLDLGRSGVHSLAFALPNLTAQLAKGHFA